MKKLLSLIIAAVMLASLLPAAQSAAGITVNLDGGRVDFDVQPQIINDRTMVPMRAIFEKLGAFVKWDGATRTVTADREDTEIIMTIGYELMFVNYDTVTLDAPPVIIGDRTLVPLRAIAESLDCTVDWEEETRTVTITTASLSPSASPENGETAEPSPSPQAESVVTSADTEEGESEEARPQRYSGGYNIVYDDENEKQSHYCSDFTITDVQLNEDGNYEITYTLKTYRDDSGNVILSFACYDEDGGRVDGFSELFHTWAYSWTEQEAVAVVSGETTRIKLLLNE